MAGENRAAADDLTRELPQELDFFHWLRRVECQYPGQPRLGTAASPADEPVRLGQEPGLDFAASSIAALGRDAGGGPLRLAVRFFGLFGSNGPLPLHLTEYAKERIQHHHDPTFAAFADVFHHRMLSLFYRAWAETQPTVAFDRPGSDRFAFYVACLAGYGLDSLCGRDAMPDRSKLFLAGLLSGSTRHVEGLAALIRVFFGMDVTISEFVGEWMEIPEEDHFRLGASLELGTLGHSAVIGAKVWGCQHRFDILLGPMGLQDYLGLLPGGRGRIVLAAIVRNYVGNELAWGVNLKLRSAEIPPLRLDGGARLGWTAWLGERTGKGDADDLTLQPSLA